jgi:acyl-CoA synthetase (AMP-forming)/AMP-acid ligase II
LSESPATIVRAAAERFPDGVALSEVSFTSAGELVEGRTVAFAALHALTLRACAALAAAGLGAGDRVAVLLDNSIEMVVSEWACLTAGFVWVALNTRTSAAELEAILADSSPSLLLVGERHAPLLEGVGVPAGCRVVRTGREWSSFLDFGAAEVPHREPRPEDAVRIRYTSGTAGAPKGAVLPRRAYDASIETVAEVIAPVRHEDVLVQVAPMSHAAGAMLLPHVRAGAQALLVDRFEARAFITIVERYRATAAFLVPTMLVRVLEALDRAERMATIRTLVYGGASMPVEPLAAAIERLGPVFVQIYGLTESTWPVTALRREDHVRRAGEDEGKWKKRLASCGKPTSIGVLRVVDTRGHDAAIGQTGELWVRGRNTMSGYWPGPTGAAKHDAKGLDAGGWMHTGDLGFLDAEGYVTIVDRLHDMIVSGGFNVYPREVEDVLCSHPAVLEAAVVGRPSTEWGETVHAAVVLKPGAAAHERELIEHCAARLAGYKKPRTLEIIERLPKNAAGKDRARSLRTV